MRRLSFERLLERASMGTSQGIAAWHVDRLFRQPRDLERLIDLADSGFRVISSHGTRDPSNPDDRFILRIEVAHAARSSDNASRRIKRRNAVYRERGRTTGGRPGFGFPRRDRTWRPGPEETAADRPNVPDDTAGAGGADRVRRRADREPAGRTRDRGSEVAAAAGDDRRPAPRTALIEPVPGLRDPSVRPPSRVATRRPGRAGRPGLRSRPSRGAGSTRRRGQPDHHHLGAGSVRGSSGVVDRVDRSLPRCSRRCGVVSRRRNLLSRPWRARRRVLAPGRQCRRGSCASARCRRCRARTARRCPSCAARSRRRLRRGPPCRG